jgi:hypothetical protein
VNFVRTPAGLAVMHKFLNVDKILFCEGGPMVRRDAQSLLGATPQTLDMIFWSHVLKFLGIKKKIHIKSCGSKSNVLAILRACASENTKTVIFAIDSDYQEFLQCPEIASFGSKLVRTYGYSWESDVINEEILLRIMRHFVGPLDKDFKRVIEKDIRIVQDKLHKWSNIDLDLIISSRLGIFDKEKPARYTSQGPGKPDLNEAFLNQCLEIRGYSHDQIQDAFFRAEESFRFTFGKLTSFFMYRLLTWHAKNKTSINTLAYDEFMRLAISNTFSPPRKRHQSMLKEFYSRQSQVFA